MHGEYLDSGDQRVTTDCHFTKKHWTVFHKQVTQQGVAWYLSAYVAAYDRDDDDPTSPIGRWLLRANQILWHLSTIHVNNNFAKSSTTAATFWLTTLAWGFATGLTFSLGTSISQLDFLRSVLAMLSSCLNLRTIFVQAPSNGLFQASSLRFVPFSLTGQWRAKNATCGRKNSSISAPCKSQILG